MSSSLPTHDRLLYAYSLSLIPSLLAQSPQAAEALGAIGNPGSLDVLNKYLADASVEVRETCEIAIAKIEFDNSDVGKEEARMNKENGSV